MESKMSAPSSGTEEEVEVKQHSRQDSLHIFSDFKTVLDSVLDGPNQQILFHANEQYFSRIHIFVGYTYQLPDKCTHLYLIFSRMSIRTHLIICRVELLTLMLLVNNPVFIYNEILSNILSRNVCRGSKSNTPDLYRREEEILQRNKNASLLEQHKVRRIFQQFPFFLITIDILSIPNSTNQE